MGLGGLPWGPGPGDLSHTVWRLGGFGQLGHGPTPEGPVGAL